MYNFLSTSWEWQWADFVITVVGSLLGFLFAILATIGTNKIVDKIKAKNLLNELKTEFEKVIVAENKNKLLASITNENETDFKILTLPHLERVVLSNEIEVLSSYKDYDKIMALYFNMKSINDWYGEISKYVLQNILQIRKKATCEAEVYSFMCNAIANETEVNYFNKIAEILNGINN